jgi:glucose-1-phosphate adenylyltransferase
MNNNLHGILFAYRTTPELKDLTLHRTLASLPFGGRYRVIDFMLSNFVNAGITDVGVIMHESYQSLLDHLGSGKDFDLARRNGGLKLLPPFAYAANDRRSSSSIYRGTMEALAGVFSYLQDIRQEYVILADAHTIINIDVGAILDSHIKSGAEITAVATSKPKAVSRDATYFIPGEDGGVSEVLVGPAAPAGLESLNMYVLSTELLLKMTESCAARDIFSLSAGVLRPGVANGSLHINPYVFDGFAERVQSVQGFYDFNRLLLDPDVRKEVFDPARPIRTKVRNDPSTYYAPSSKVVNSMVANGCVIEGTVENSVIFHGVHIAKGAVVKDCVIMQSSTIEENAELSSIITDKNVVISAGKKLNGAPNCPFVVPKGSVV